VKPGDQDDFITHGNPFKSLNNLRIHFEPGVGRAFKSLVGGRLTTDQDGAYDTNGIDLVSVIVSQDVPKTRQFLKSAGIVGRLVPPPEAIQTPSPSSNERQIKEHKA
jgi:hypothetical protein